MYSETSNNSLIGRSFNVILGAAGTTVQHYLEENNLEIISHERQTIKYGDEIVKTGVLKFKCLQKEGFQNLPNNKMLYNNRKLGFRHPEQYEERNKQEVEKQQQKGIELQNAERNRKMKEIRRQAEEEKRREEKEKEELIQQQKDDGDRFTNVWKHMPEVSTLATAKANYLSRMEKDNPEVRLSPKQFSDRKEGFIQEEETNDGEEGMEFDQPAKMTPDKKREIQLEELTGKDEEIINIQPQPQPQPQPPHHHHQQQQQQLEQLPHQHQPNMQPQQQLQPPASPPPQTKPLPTTPPQSQQSQPTEQMKSAAGGEDHQGGVPTTQQHDELLQEGEDICRKAFEKATQQGMEDLTANKTAPEHTAKDG